MKRKKVLSLLLTAALCVSLTACGASAGSASGDSSTVESATAESGDVRAQVVGTGSLSQADAEEVAVPVGLEVEKVYVKEGDTVKEGDPIAKVTQLSVKQQMLSIDDTVSSIKKELKNLSTSDSNYTLKKEIYNEELDDLKETRSELEDLQDGCLLTSTESGTVSTVNLQEGQTITKNTVSTQQLTSGGSGSGSTSVDSSTIQSMLGTSYETSGNDEAKAADLGLAYSKEGKGAVLSNTAAAIGTGAATESGSSTPVELGGNIAVVFMPPVSGLSQSDKIVSGMQVGTQMVMLDSKLEWDPQGDSFQVDTPYTAHITLSVPSGAYLTDNLENLAVSLNGTSLDMTNSQYSFTLSDENGDGLADTISFVVPDLVPTDTQSGISGMDGSSMEDLLQNYLAGAGSSSMLGDLSGYGLDTSGFDTSGLSASGLSGSVDAAGTSSYDATKTAGITVAPDDEAYLEINVDEMDINSIQEGQKAEIKVDAIEGETFAGKILEIAQTAQNENGSAKYKVKISLYRDIQMKYGMSAEATIITDEKDDVVLVPVDAVQTENGESVVYTSVDAKGNLGGAVTVEIGLSDGEKVEITKGLSVGDKVYYPKSQENYNDAAEEMTGESEDGTEQ